jgi:hypothetical protein
MFLASRIHAVDDQHVTVPQIVLGSLELRALGVLIALFPKLSGQVQ